MNQTLMMKVLKNQTVKLKKRKKKRMMTPAGTTTAMFVVSLVRLSVVRDVPKLHTSNASNLELYLKTTGIAMIAG